MSSPADERLRLEARQRELAAERRESELAWTHELLARPTAALVQRAFRALGFREPVAYDEQHLPIRDLVRLLRGRTSVGWSFRDVEPLVLPPARYERIGEVVDVRGELPSVVISTAVEAGARLAFEVDLDHREWVVERGGAELGYVGLPPPAVGSPVYLVGPQA
jgi:hypothetical protein